MPITSTAGYWISPGGDVVRVLDHARHMASHPKDFGLDAADPRFKDRRRREELITAAVRNDWIRVRLIPREIHQVNFRENTPRTLDNLLALCVKLPHDAWDDDVHFTELSRNARRTNSLREFMRREMESGPLRLAVAVMAYNGVPDDLRAAAERLIASADRSAVMRAVHERCAEAPAGAAGMSEADLARRVLEPAPPQDGEKGRQNETE
ncbi:MAG TPA: hypothetical protein ENN09_06935 [Planctomycetes bacterium]|nr:hypothetical protein [Planctomycetota bacterium]